MNLIINTDGASRGNPGAAAYSFLIKSDAGVILHQEGQTLGTTTNNIAEYTAVIKALEYVQANYSRKGPHQIKVLADSQLMVEQLSGRYKVKNPGILELHTRIKQIEGLVGNLSYQHIPRSENFIADKLANIALDKSIV